MALKRNENYAQVTQKILDELNSDKVHSWHRPWVPIKDSPRNWQDKPYENPMNNFLLSIAQRDAGYDSVHWLTQNRGRREGGLLKEDEEPVKIWGTFFKYKVGNDFYDVNKIPRNKKGKGQNVPCFTPNKLYNVCQFNWGKDGVPPQYDKSYYSNDEIAESDIVKEVTRHMSYYLDKHKIKVIHTGSRAFYSIESDNIQMPPLESFVKPQAYASVFAHEIVHSTARKDRCNRKIEENIRGEDNYNREELIAELGSNLMLHHLGIPYDKTDWESTVAYIKSYATSLMSNPSLFPETDKAARRAVSYINKWAKPNNKKEVFEKTVRRVGNKWY
jgi:antirestriction protein ArdC